MTINTVHEGDRSRVWVTKNDYLKDERKAQPAITMQKRRQW